MGRLGASDGDDSDVESVDDSGEAGGIAGSDDWSEASDNEAAVAIGYAVPENDVTGAHEDGSAKRSTVVRLLQGIASYALLNLTFRRLMMLVFFISGVILMRPYICGAIRRMDDGMLAAVYGNDGAIPSTPLRCIPDSGATDTVISDASVMINLNFDAPRKRFRVAGPDPVYSSAMGDIPYTAYDILNKEQYHGVVVVHTLYQNSRLVCCRHVTWRSMGSNHRILSAIDGRCGILRLTRNGCLSWLREGDHITGKPANSSISGEMRERLVEFMMILVLRGAHLFLLRP